MSIAFRTLDELVQAHAGETAWIFGKGPSLDLCGFDAVGKLRLCINESLLKVPEPTYFFAHDIPPIQRVAKQWPETCQAVLELTRAKKAIEAGIPEGQILVYSKSTLRKQLFPTPGEITEQNTLFSNLGTIQSAIHFCVLIGVPKVVLVGVDGHGGYAASLNLANTGKNHQAIRDSTIEILKELGIQFEFYSDMLNK